MPMNRIQGKCRTQYDNKKEEFGYDFVFSNKRIACFCFKKIKNRESILVKEINLMEISKRICKWLRTHLFTYSFIHFDEKGFSWHATRKDCRGETGVGLEGMP